MDARDRFAANLRAAREQSGLSQEALGDAVGLHRTEVSLLERAGRDPRLETIVRLAGSNSKIEFRELPTDDPKQRQPDISRARKLIGWEPEVALEDGLRMTLEYFRSVV